MINQYSFLNGNKIKVKINNQDLPYLQAIEFGMSVDDVIAEAKFLCLKEPLVYADEGVEEVYGVGMIKDIERTKEHVIFQLEMGVDTPNVEYWKEKFYPEIEVEEIHG